MSFDFIAPLKCSFFDHFIVLFKKSFFILIIFRQLLDLFVSWDWTTYFADFGKTESNKYQRVPPATALSLLEKLKEADKKSMFGGINLNKKDRDKVKLREVVHKQLKSLVQQTSS